MVFRSLLQDVFLLPLPVVTPLTLFSGLGSARFQGQGNSAQLFAAFTFWMIPFDRGHRSPSCSHEGEKANPRDAHDIEQAPHPKPQNYFRGFGVGLSGFLPACLGQGYRFRLHQGFEIPVF